MLEFADWIQITQSELDARYRLLDLLETLIKEHLPEAEVFMFGSTANRLALPGSDIDVLVSMPGVTQNSTYNLLFDSVVHIIAASKLFDEIEPIKTAQVPIIQARHRKSGISIDLVIEREDGLQGLCLVVSLKEAFPELHPLYLLVKSFLCNKNVHKPWKGGIGSFVLINLITVYLQSIAKQETRKDNIGIHGLVIGFLYFIGEEFQHRHVGLSILAGGFAFDRRNE